MCNKKWSRLTIDGKFGLFWGYLALNEAAFDRKALKLVGNPDVSKKPPDCHCYSRCYCTVIELPPISFVIIIRQISFTVKSKPVNNWNGGSRCPVRLVLRELSTKDGHYIGLHEMYSPNTLHGITDWQTLKRDGQWKRIRIRTQSKELN